MTAHVIFLLLGLTLLLAGGTGLVSGASALAQRHGISPLVIGMTVVAFGTSAPELVVNIIGALENETALAFGNVAGSNIANLGLVLGMAALVRPVVIEGQIVRRELPLLLLGTLMLLVMTLDPVILKTPAIVSRSEGLILLLLFSIFMYISAGDLLRKDQDPLLDNLRKLEESLPAHRAQDPRRDWLWLGGGTIALGIGGQLTIDHGSALAIALGVSPVIIGLYVVAVGTSMPELVTSIIAAVRRESDLCVGNVVGSNIFNCLFVLPLSAIIRPLPIPQGGILDVVVSLLFAAMIIPVFLRGRATMGRWMGLAFIACYMLYAGRRLFA